MLSSSKKKLWIKAHGLKLIKAHGSKLFVLKDLFPREEKTASSGKTFE